MVIAQNVSTGNVKVSTVRELTHHNVSPNDLSRALDYAVTWVLNKLSDLMTVIALETGSNWPLVRNQTHVEGGLASLLKWTLELVFVECWRHMLRVVNKENFQVAQIADGREKLL